MPWKGYCSRYLVFKRLATGITGRNGVFGAISGQFPAKLQLDKNGTAVSGGFMATPDSQCKEISVGRALYENFAGKASMNRNFPHSSKRKRGSLFGCGPFDVEYGLGFQVGLMLDVLAARLPLTLLVNSYISSL
jgi:hypothetical protein